VSSSWTEVQGYPPVRGERLQDGAEQEMPALRMFLEELVTEVTRERHPRRRRVLMLPLERGPAQHRASRPAPGTGQAAGLPTQGEEHAVPRPAFHLHFVWPEPRSATDIL